MSRRGFRNTSTSRPDEQCVDSYLKIFPLLKPHQRVWVVPGMFGDDSPGSLAGSMEHQEDKLLEQLENYWTWMKAEPRIASVSHPHRVSSIRITRVHR